MTEFKRLYPYAGESEPLTKEQIIEDFKKYIESPLRWAGGAFLIICTKDTDEYGVQWYNRREPEELIKDIYHYGIDD